MSKPTYTLTKTEAAIIESVRRLPTHCRACHALKQREYRARKKAQFIAAIAIAEAYQQKRPQP